MEAPFFLIDQIILQREVVSSKLQKLNKEYLSLLAASTEQLTGVSGDIAESVATHELHMELMDMLKQMNIFIELIASTLLKLELENN